MTLEIIEKEIMLDIYGFGGKAINKDYAGTAFKLMDKMWQAVRSNKLENKGQNIWVYDQDHKVFAGVELNQTPDPNTGLERETVMMCKYAYFRHIGPYQKIGQSGQYMREVLKRKGYEVIMPYIEIYGHWTEDETKLETELLMCLK